MHISRLAAYQEIEVSHDFLERVSADPRNVDLSEFGGKLTVSHVGYEELKYAPKEVVSDRPLVVRATGDAGVSAELYINPDQTRRQRMAKLIRRNGGWHNAALYRTMPTLQ